MIPALDLPGVTAPPGEPGSESGSRRGIAAVGLAAAVATLVVAGPSHADLAAMTTDPFRWAESAGLDGAVAQVAAVVAWATLGWVTAGGALVVLARLPGAAGHLAATAADAVVPLVIRRGLEATLGLSLVAGAVGGTPPAAAQTPTTIPSTAADAGPFERPFPSPTPSPEVPDPATPRTPAVETPSLPGPPAPAVTVAPGDCLWDIAEDYLGDHPTDRQVDRAWRRWYAANRMTVGPDPGLIHPGQRLVAPRDAGIPSSPPDAGGTP